MTVTGKKSSMINLVSKRLKLSDLLLWFLFLPLRTRYHCCLMQCLTQNKCFLFVMAFTSLTDLLKSYHFRQVSLTRVWAGLKWFNFSVSYHSSVFSSWKQKLIVSSLEPIWLAGDWERPCEEVIFQGSSYYKSVFLIVIYPRICLNQRC